jgi:serpin B
MKRLLLLALVAAVGCGTKPSPPAPEAKPPAKAKEAPGADVTAVAAGGTDFAFDLYRKLDAEGNLFVSPYSISTALGMAYAGVSPEAAAEMEKVLRYPFRGERLHVANAGLIGGLSGGGFRVANSLWGGEGFPEAFLAVNRDCYGAEVRTLKLKGAEPTINRWVAEQTGGRIRDVLPDGFLTDDTEVVLVNAVHFKGQWKEPFEPYSTHEGEFRTGPGKSIKAKMMHQRARHQYARIKVDGVQVLELPYKNSPLSMVIVLPDADDGLAAVTTGLTKEKLSGWMHELKGQKVDVTLPRFTISGNTLSLKEPLKQLGMVKVFTPVKGWLSLSEGLHQGFVEVNEEGTKAAAVTVVKEKEKGGIPDKEDEPVQFRADHPFLFLIRDSKSGAVVFLGRLVTPGT